MDTEHIKLSKETTQNLKTFANQKAQAEFCFQLIVATCVNEHGGAGKSFEKPKDRGNIKSRNGKFSKIY